MDIFSVFLTPFRSPTWQWFIFIWKIIAFIIVTFSLIGTVVVLIRSIPTRIKIKSRLPELGASTYTIQGGKEKAVRKEWEELLKQVSVTSDDNAGLIVIAADNITDGALQKIGMPGSTMSDRIHAVSGQLKSINDLWAVHRFRNKIAHGKNHYVSTDELQDILKKYENVLTELDVI